ncbi:hypothetical protein [Vibrio hepatarius]|uniref:hypothetical protein n=1 Tax=Vibrio hepatarius TaxID=171383 RepID=UPI001C0A5F74|nr:hypothetical protein [Vibrio hepatarius]MBU2898043.1 hypothetical protein [Vibrio hepatarius]
MSDFFKTSKTVYVSRINQQGWWLENIEEHVSKGTALGSEYTQRIYKPSQKGKTARFDKESNQWSEEIEDMTWKKYWDENGNDFIIGKPDGDFPSNAILEPPPEYNRETHAVLYSKIAGWKVYAVRIGQAFYDEQGHELIVSDKYFDLPEGHTWEAPPSPKEGYAIKHVDGKWVQIIDYRGKIAYAKNRNDPSQQDYIIEQIGEVPNSHTLSEPQPYDSWMGENLGWKYDAERHRPFKQSEEKSWRDSELTKVLNRIDQYEKDKNYPNELRTSPISSEVDFLKLVEDRKVLSDYPDTEHFPFGERPTLSGLAN